MKYLAHEITYTKHFITGPLAGLTHDVAYAVDQSACCKAQAALNAITQEEPAADSLTGTLYWASGVRCREVDDAHIQEHGIRERLIA